MPFASLWLLPLIYIVKSYYFFPFTEPFINLLSRVYHFNAARVLGLHSHQRAMLRHTRKQELKYVGVVCASFSPLHYFQTRSTRSACSPPHRSGERSSRRAGAGGRGAARGGGRPCGSGARPAAPAGTPEFAGSFLLELGTKSQR